MLPKNIQAARLRLTRSRPYLSSALWSMVPVEKPGLGTMAVDKWWRLYFDPSISWSAEEIEGVLYHEVQHLLRSHPERGEATASGDFLVWELAADAEINDDLISEKVKLPSDPVLPRNFCLPNGKLAEEYFSALKSQRPAQPRAAAGLGPSAPGTVAKIGEVSRCGSCAHGMPQDHEDGPPSKRSPGVTLGEAELIRQKVAREILEHVHSRGDVPAGLRRWAEERLSSKVNWRKELASACRSAISHTSGMVDYSYQKLSRRQSVSSKIIFPSLRRPVPSVAVVIDTSGSISDRMLSQATAEVIAVARSACSKEGIRVIVCDAAVHASRRVFAESQIRPLLAGGGGTDMRVGIKAALDLKPKPQVIIVITDGLTPWPERPPAGVKAIVCLLGKDAKAPRWAKEILIEV